MENKIFVGNLNFKFKDNDLKKMFEEFGEIEDCVIITDNKTRRSKGFGFVTFVNSEDAKDAVDSMNEKEIEGRKLIVNIAKPKEEDSRPRRDGFRNDHGNHDDVEDEFSKYYSTTLM
jgi:RNA recognition motif-containing protein